ncbi:MAG: multidrug effflux MFS transporter [Boseongicola sp. SB0664_bin_43]|uniref:Multidrug effflux MFS transporter n=1 Tax=Boseongicola sp. SB0664_bin_43 TaxID=2604844 RepID=A0A6B0XW72_9RHOB|nr:multidrug effflux MFS transporter [Boseongicola sp. SB0664_bin_43]
MSPIVGSGAGGLFEHFLSWRFGFVTLSACSAALLAVEMTTRPAEPPRWQPSSFTGMFAAARDPRTLAFALPCFLVMAGVFAFLTSGPYIVVNSLNRPALEFAMLASAVATGVLLGSWVTGRAPDLRAPFLVCAGAWGRWPQAASWSCAA